MNDLPKRGAYAVYRNHELAAVLGYDLEQKQAHLLKHKDIALEEAEAFVEEVLAGRVPPTPREQTIVLETWELYGMPSGPIEDQTKWVSDKLEQLENNASTYQS